MKSVMNVVVVLFAVVLFSGCYTELATVERNDHKYAYDSDTSYENENTTINNHYYLDDDYRRSRLRVSFNYYYPSYSSWISTYYHSYFNDYYWGMYHRPSWYYDPFYSYNPYPWGRGYPYYYPWNPYYSPVVYYPAYYAAPVYVSTPAPNPGRVRDNGSTRDPNPGDRSRPIEGTPTPQPTTVATGRTGVGIDNEATPVKSQDRKRDNEVPWWEKKNNDRPTRIADDEARPNERDRGNGSTYTPPRKERPRDDRPTYDSPKNNRPNEEAKPVERPKREQPKYAPPKNDRPNEEAKPVERPKREQPTYTPPKQSVPKDESRPVERPRESRRPSYNPPPQFAPPSSSPPRSSGGSPSSSGGNERKRD